MALIALVALGFREGGPMAALAPTPGRLLEGLVVAAVGAVASSGLLRGCVWWGPLRRLQVWQSRLVAGWSTTDAVAVALLSGVAEEALMRAVLQPVIGLYAAAAVFAVLHLVPDRELWLWPVLAFALGIGFGLLFERYGYPAAAAAHTALNLIAIHQLRNLDHDRLSDA